MKTFIRFMSVLIAVFYLYIIFIKVWYHSVFRLQMMNDPVLKPYATTLSILFPIILLLISILLCIDKNIKFRYGPVNTLEYGLVGSFILLCLLARYFYVLPHFYEGVGCSCIGIIPSFSWQGNFYTTISILAINSILIVLLFIHDRAKKKLVATDRLSSGA